MHKILLTGHSGFIGERLLKNLKKIADVHCLVSDLKNHQAVRQEILLTNPDLVIHLAAQTEVERSFYQQTTFCDVNFVGTVNLIDSLITCANKPKIIFASTMEVYGWQPISDAVFNQEKITPQQVFDPDTTICHPNAPYAVAKYASEKYIEYVHRSFGLDYVILRQTNAYGRNNNDFFVTEQIITQMLNNQTECRLGNPLPYRNFIFIDDVISAWMTCIENFDKISNNIFTLGPNNALPIIDYAKLIAKKLNWNGQIHWNTKPARPGEIYFLNSNYKKLQNFTGWQPKIDLNLGLDLTIDVWKNKIL